MLLLWASKSFRTGLRRQRYVHGGVGLQVLYTGFNSLMFKGIKVTMVWDIIPNQISKEKSSWATPKMEAALPKGWDLYDDMHDVTIQKPGILR